MTSLAADRPGSDLAPYELTYHVMRTTCTGAALALRARPAVTALAGDSFGRGPSGVGPSAI